jgi:hypothetical protein
MVLAPVLIGTPYSIRRVFVYCLQLRNRTDAALFYLLDNSLRPERRPVFTGKTQLA